MKFTEGMQVYNVDGRTAYFTVHTVTKVHKTGNFTIDGGKQQYRQDGSECGTWRTCLEPLTPEKHEELKANRAAKERQYAFRDAADKLGRMGWRQEISEEQLEAILLLVSQLVKPVKSE